MSLIAPLLTRRLVLLGLAVMGGGPALAQDDSSPAPPGGRAKFRWPVRGAILKKFKAGENDGIDIAAPVGEPVHAAADGTCISANEELKTYGKLVVLRHDDGYVTVYAGNSEIEVKEGDKIRRGQIIAKSGDSGEPPAPRLHFELRKDGKAIDPIRFLVPL